MGEGLFLEQGTHNELLTNENGAYSRLVQAQKLRERRQVTTFDVDTPSTTGSGEDEELGKAVRGQTTLSRKDTIQSLASEVSEKKLEAYGDFEKGHGDTDHSLPYLFKRMGNINREGWVIYAMGSIFAFSKLLFYRIISYLLSFSEWRHPPRFWHRLW
jgi:ATP-binding cassette subfamily B (MDR/TAP) protein 1